MSNIRHMKLSPHRPQSLVPAFVASVFLSTSTLPYRLVTSILDTLADCAGTIGREKSEIVEMAIINLTKSDEIMGNDML